MVAVAVGAPPPAEHGYGKMATYLKRTSKLFDLGPTRPSADVSLRELMCPVCRGILIEPVTLPCTHNLCLRCLRGTFEHNSLSCPLCRVRVGSWLRTATKSESLVNNGLWELIRAKFPKEIEDKHNGDERDIELDAGFSTTKKILSAAGEIRTEYEAQLQMAEEEMRRQRESEQIASEALIRKIQAEEQQQQLAQLAQDQLFAKTLAKKQAAEKQKEATSKCYGEYPATASGPNCSFDMSKFNIAALTDVGTSKIESQGLEGGKMNFLEMRDGSELRRSNIALISKIRAERFASSMKANSSNVYKDAAVKFCCQKPMPVYNAITRTLKHQAVTTVTQPCTSSYASEPGSSTSKIYGMQAKEELHVPNDVVNSKKKSLGVEVCMTLAEDDERIGSAESAGSHDSINQEIHHFKPIKAMPRTPLKISTDGRQIDPKLIRVVPILKRISNAVPKPPSQSHLKRIIGCSWSAFRGKTRQVSREKEALVKEEGTLEPDEKPSTSYQQPQLTAKLAKGQTHDTIRRLDFVPEVTVDGSKNCTKSRVFNGTKVSKKLSLDEQADVGKVPKSWKTHVRNGMVAKCKRRRNVWSVRKDGRSMTEVKDSEENGVKSSLKPSPCEEALEDDAAAAAVENIAERIKKRKVNVEKKIAQSASSSEQESEGNRRTGRKRYCGKDEPEEEATGDEEDSTVEKKSRTRPTRSNFPRTKRQRARVSTQSNLEGSDKSESPRANGKTSGLRKSTRNTKNSYGSSSNEQEVASEKSAGNKYGYDSSREYESSSENAPSIMGRPRLSDEAVIKEQERMERLVIQEKSDFELARRLQAKFDEMGRIAGRTRRSRRAIESESIEVDLYKIEIGRTVGGRTVGGRTAAAKRVGVGVGVGVGVSEAKKRGRPPKRVK